MQYCSARPAGSTTADWELHSPNGDKESIFRADVSPDNRFVVTIHEMVMSEPAKSKTNFGYLALWLSRSSEYLVNDSDLQCEEPQSMLPAIWPRPHGRRVSNGR